MIDKAQNTAILKPKQTKAPCACYVHRNNELKDSDGDIIGCLGHGPGCPCFEERQKK